ncbi:MAG: glycerol-3-phosphate 1-O-acyltransferase PlsY [Alphaproteobacteria bacterium]|nr:glycerol-3-phosphate 1-O-acyltransferase PlsY [Alphaproteobacteria bacterium]
MFFTFLIGYFIGSIPFGFLLSKLAGYGDIRKIGSGNIGATNVLRTGNKALAGITLFLDMAKGAVPILLTINLSAPPDPSVPDNFINVFALLFGLGAIIGHCFPVWLKFKGGKGVATTIGVLLASVPYAGLVACITWLIFTFTFRISSLAALASLATALIATFFIYGSPPFVIVLIITVLVYFRHKDNIKRLIEGTEPKIRNKND